MAKIHYRAFAGEVPRSEPHLLADGQAQLSQWCDVSTGALSPIQGGALLTTLASNPVRGIYTEDGINYYSWPQETIAVRSPIPEDTYNRMYWLTPASGVMQVSSKLGMLPSGPTPLAGNTWRVGVPRPTVAPELSLIDRTTLPDYPNVNWVADAWWESSGTAYGKAAVTLVQTQAFRRYTFAPPAQPGGTPSGAVLVLKVQLRDSDAANQVIATATMRANSTSSTKVSSLPGGAEFTMSVDGAAGVMTIEWGPESTRAYTYAYTNDWEETGAPAPPATIAPTYLQDVQIVVATESFTGYRPFLRHEIFRTYGTNTTYIKATVTGTAPTYVDATRTPGSVGTALESSDWTPPPTGLEGLCSVPNGWLAAFKGTTLYMTEALYPHAWPYTQTFPTAIRGVHASQQSLVVTCADGTYVVSGAYPSNTQQRRLDLPQAGIAARSMTSLDGVIAFASNDGLPLVQGSQGSMTASQSLFTRKVWRERYGDILADASLRLSYHDGFLVGTSHTTAKGFLVRLDDGPATFTRTDERIDATFQLPVTDTLYYSVGNAIYQFRGGTNKSMTWWGKDQLFASHTAFGAGFIRCDGPTLVEVFADGVLWHSDTRSSGYFRLPAGKKALRWSVRLSGQYTVREFALAATMQELREG